MIPLVDHLAPSAAAIESVNTIVNDHGVLTARNTDYAAVAELLRTRNVSASRQWSWEVSTAVPARTRTCAGP